MSDHQQLSREYFRFKQFFVRHDRCAMKVGTDGILLGAWARIPDGRVRILDVGSGSGLISLQLAQRYPEAVLTALEIEEEAALQSAENFMESPWSDRLECIIGDFADPPAFSDLFHGIISNPPFHSASTSKRPGGRGRARNTSALPPSTLFRQAFNLSSSEARFSLIWPGDTFSEIEEGAALAGWFPSRLTRIRTRIGGPCKRILSEWVKVPANRREEDELCIGDAEGNYSREYIRLTADFYLDL